MSELLELMVWLIMLPFVMIFLLGIVAIGLVSTILHWPTAIAAFWFGWSGLWLSLHQSNNSDRQFLTIAEMIAQSHIGPLSAPFAFMIVSLILLVVSFSIRLKYPVSQFSD